MDLISIPGLSFITSKLRKPHGCDLVFERCAVSDFTFPAVSGTRDRPRDVAVMTTNHGLITVSAIPGVLRRIQVSTARDCKNTWIIVSLSRDQGVHFKHIIILLKLSFLSISTM